MVKEKQTSLLKLSEEQKKELIQKAKENKEYPDSIDWNEYKENDIVIGKILMNEKKDIDFEDNQRTVVPLLTEEGYKSLWLSKLLSNKLEDLGVKHNDTICIIYKGKIKSKKGFKYHDFDVSVL